MTQGMRWTDSSESVSATREELAYLAGILDGEGCITVTRQTRNSQPTVTVAVSMTDDVPPRLLQQHFGGNLRQSQRDEKYKPMWTFRIQARKAERLLRATRPYLRVKARQADLCLELRDSMAEGMILRRGPYADRHPERTAEIHEFRNGVIKQIRALNKRGVTVAA